MLDETLRRSLPLLLVALAAAGGASAQTVYRIVGPDGKVSFSDKPPVQANAPGEVGKAGVGTNSQQPGGGEVRLPYELQQTVAKSPVTLYSSTGCNPCKMGRTLLEKRGIPFSEKSVATAEDIDALQRLSGETSLPLLTVGGQRLKGFSDVEWQQALNTAGYPASSVLPRNYRNPPVTPLVVVHNQAATASAAASKPSAPAEPALPPLPPPPAAGSNNPAGIQF